MWYNGEEEAYDTPAYMVYGVACGSFEEACIVAGIETPAQLRAEEEYYRERGAIFGLRDPVFIGRCECSFVPRPEPNDDPFGAGLPF